MAIPTRLAVLLQRRKSAAAGLADPARAKIVTIVSTSTLAAVLEKFPCLIATSESASTGWPVNDNGAEVGDVGKRRTGREQIADAVEKPGGIVVGEKIGGIEAGGLGALQSGVVDKRPGRVVGAATAAIGA